MRAAWALSALATLAVSAPAFAQARSPAAIQMLVELSRVLGESHAIQQACRGDGEQVWRERMQQLLEAEAPDQRLKARLSVSFNEGYHTGQALYPQCTAGARAEARRIAASGRSLSEKLEGP